jgi:hypothetical protein
MGERFIVRASLAEGLIWIGYLLSLLCIAAYLAEIGMDSQIQWSSAYQPPQNNRLYAVLSNTFQSQTYVASFVWFLLNLNVFRLFLGWMTVFLCSEIRTMLWYAVYKLFLFFMFICRLVELIIYIVVFLNCDNVWYCFIYKGLYKETMIFASVDVGLCVLLYIWQSLLHIQSIEAEARELRLRRYIGDHSE